MDNPIKNEGMTITEFEKMFNRAVHLALKHWAYVYDVIENHLGWGLDDSNTKDYINSDSAYVAGFILGYIGKQKNKNCLDYSCEEEFHYDTAHKHGQKHRKQDDTETRTQETIL